MNSPELAAAQEQLGVALAGDWRGCAGRVCEKVAWIATARVRDDTVLNKVVTPRQASVVLSLRVGVPAAGVDLWVVSLLVNLVCWVPRRAVAGSYSVSIRSRVFSLYSDRKSSDCHDARGVPGRIRAPKGAEAGTRPDGKAYGCREGYTRCPVVAAACALQIRLRTASGMVMRRAIIRSASPPLRIGRRQECNHRSRSMTSYKSRVYCQR